MSAAFGLEAPRLMPSFVKCPHCGYAWTFAKKAACFSCGGRLAPEPREVAKPHGVWTDPPKLEAEARKGKSRGGKGRGQRRGAPEAEQQAQALCPLEFLIAEGGPDAEALRQVQQARAERARPATAELVETPLSRAGAKQRRADKALKEKVDLTKQAEAALADARAAQQQAADEEAQAQEELDAVKASLAPQQSQPEPAAGIDLAKVLAGDLDSINIVEGDLLSLGSEEELNISAQEREEFNATKAEFKALLLDSLRKAFGGMGKEIEARKKAYEDAHKRLAAKRRRTEGGAEATVPANAAETPPQLEGDQRQPQEDEEVAKARAEARQRRADARQVPGSQTK